MTFFIWTFTKHILSLTKGFFKWKIYVFSSSSISSSPFSSCGSGPVNLLLTPPPGHPKPPPLVFPLLTTLLPYFYRTSPNPSPRSSYRSSSNSSSSFSIVPPLSSFLCSPLAPTPRGQRRNSEPQVCYGAPSQNG